MLKQPLGSVAWLRPERLRRRLANVSKLQILRFQDCHRNWDILIELAALYKVTTSWSYFNTSTTIITSSTRIHREFAFILELMNSRRRRGTFPKNIPENLGLRLDVLGNTFRNPEITPENLTGPKSFRLFWETHGCTGLRCALNSSVIQLKPGIFQASPIWAAPRIYIFYERGKLDNPKIQPRQPQVKRNISVSPQRDAPETYENIDKPRLTKCPFFRFSSNLTST